MGEAELLMFLLLLALYIGLIASTLILMLSDLAAGWIFVVFTVVVSVALFFLQRARITAASFLLASLAVLFAGLLGMSHSEKEWITIVTGGGMAAFSAFVLYWAAFKFKPEPESVSAEDEATEGAGTARVLKCPSCGSPDVEGDYPEFHCPYCGTRFMAAQAPGE